MSAYGVGIISSETPRRCGLLARSRSCSSSTRSLRSACFVTSYRVRLSTFRRKREEELDEPRLIKAANDFFDCLLTAFPVLEDLVEGANPIGCHDNQPITKIVDVAYFTTTAQEAGHMTLE